MKKCFVFPGQGSQFVGMGQELYDAFSTAKDIFHRVDNALNFSLKELMFSGDMEQLNLTKNTQPALMTVSIAMVEVLKNDFNVNIGDYVAGHSLGEYTALCAAGVLDIENTAKLLRLRGKSMQKAVPVGVGAMAAILAIDFDTLENIITKASHGEHYCSIANDNVKGQIVISGHRQAVERACEYAKQAGAKRAIILPVSAPFHCKLMKPVAKIIEDKIKNIKFKKPLVPIITNVLADKVSDIDIIKQCLIDQVCGRVRWRESLDFMKINNVSTIIECGAGKVLSGLVRNISELNAITLNTVKDVENFVKNKCSGEI